MNKEILDKRIQSIKETMEKMPKNNIKTNQKYSLYIDKILEESNNLKTKINNEINNRYQQILTKINNQEIKQEENVEKYERCIPLINKYNTSYEKSNLDKIIYEILHYFHDDFSKVNKSIRNAINIFYTTNIELTENDFNYTIYVNKYMKLFLQELKKNTTNSENLKKCFEEIYWQCPDLISQIGYNLIHLYYQNKKTFDKYYETKKNKILQELQLNEIEAIEKYKLEINKKEAEEKNNIRNITNNFLDKTYKISEYSEDKINSYYTQLGDNTKNVNTIKNLLTTLKEYKYYKKYLYIINDIISIYKEKNKYKDVFKKKLNEIEKKVSKITKLTKQYKSIEKSKLFYNPNKLEKIKLESETKTIEIKPLYEELEIDKFNELIYTLSDSISLYDLLYIASSHYIYLKKIIKKNNEALEKEEIDKEIEEITKFINAFNINIINNISINEERNIAQIISDKYKLLGINITTDTIENNLDATIETIEKIILINNIENTNITYEEIEFLCSADEIINK